MKTWNALLVDDETNNLALLRKMIEKHCPEIGEVRTEKDATKVISLLRVWQPEILFLDIEMPELNGLELAEHLRGYTMHVVFVTAHPEYALMAFEVQADGFLSKPVEAQKLIRIVRHLYEREKLNNTDVAAHRSSPPRLTLPTLRGIQLIITQDVVYCESQGNYTLVFLENGQKITVSRQLGEMYHQLPEDTFVRIHDRYIINLHYMSEYIRGRGGDVCLGPSVVLPVSQSRKSDFLQRLEHWLHRKP